MERIIDANGFQQSEIVMFNRWNDKDGKSKSIIYTKINGRLRLAHNENDQLSITTQIIKYDADLAIVCANTVTEKGSFSGMGMASSDRDKEIFPAILELAETRSIARSLRFAGYGIDFCSAEEVSHFEQENPSPLVKNGQGNPKRPIVHHPYANNKSAGNKGNSDNGNGRLSQKQHSFLLHLAE